MHAQTSRFKHYLEIGVNISLILVSVALLAILARTYIFPAQYSAKALAKDDVISFVGNPVNSSKTLLIFMRSGCEFCTNSAPFYRELASAAARLSDVKIVPVFSVKDEKSDKYIKQLGLDGLEARKTDFENVGVSGTPTIALVDEKGRVREYWRGFLSPGQRIDLKQKIGIVAAADFYIDSQGLEKLRKADEATVVLDVRDRESFAANHISGAKNIPLDELSVRAVNELQVAVPVVVRGDSLQDAETAYDILLKEGFLKVYIIRPVE